MQPPTGPHTPHREGSESEDEDSWMSAPISQHFSPPHWTVVDQWETHQRKS